MRSWESISPCSVLLLGLCLVGVVVVVVGGKECNNIPTERVSHTIRARGIENGAVTLSEEVGAANDGAWKGGKNSEGGVLVMPKLGVLLGSWRKLLVTNGWKKRRERDEGLPVKSNRAAGNEIEDDVLVEFDDWGQAWRTIAKSLVDRNDAKRAENSRTYHTLQSQVADEIVIQRGSPDSVEDRTSTLDDQIVSQLEPAVVGLLKVVSLHKVRLGADSPLFIAQNTNLQYLLELDVDNMMWSFRKVANLSAPGQPYGGWESPASELRGHFVGHFLSASALMWASTHNKVLHAKMNGLLGALKECQLSIGTGYLSAFPSEFFDRFEAIESVWAPYYTIHKIMAGLLDQYLHAGSKDALDMVVEMANYFHKRVKTVIEKFTIERHWRSLNEETGGMNDVLYRLYTVTGNNKHLELAHLFDKPCFLGPLALQADHLSGFHSNTHIPIVVGAQMRYEVTSDLIYRTIAEYFMGIVNSSHSYATGGTSFSEFWTDPMRQGDTLHTENQETCTTYNMLKIARTLFRWTKDIKYMDYYDRALMNGILGTQRGQQPGVMIYMLPMGPGVSKARSYHGWGNKFNSFWCCYGTAIESFAKLGDSIYFEDDGDIPSVYVAQLVSSDFVWDSAGLVLHQSQKPLNAEQSILEVTFSFSHATVVHAFKDAAIHVRLPSWVRGCRAYLNGQEIESPIPGKLLSIARAWSSDDELVLSLHMSLRLEKIQDDRAQYSALHAIMYGPLVMAGLSTGDWKLGHKDNLTQWVYPVPAAHHSQLSTFSQFHVSAEYSGSLYLACNDGTAIMRYAPEDGTNECGLSTFRVSDVPGNYSQMSFGDDKRLVSLELFSQPGILLQHNGEDKPISTGSPGCLQHKKRHSVKTHPQTLGDCLIDGTVFSYLPGLTGKSGTVSFEAVDKPGCFLSSNFNGSSVLGGVFLRCKTSGNDDTLNAFSTFDVQTGVAAYHPVSFIAEGQHRNFLLAPLNSLRDESYTIYFDMG